MRRLVLVKHAMPEIEPDKPASSWRLGELGRHRSDLLAARLRGFSPQAVWSSREPKAIETAETVASAFGIPASTLAGLEEHDRSNVPFFETMDEFERAVEHFFREPDRLVLGTETAEQALERFTIAIDQIISAGHADSVVVTHGTVMTLYAARVAGVRQMCFWSRLGLPSFVVMTLPDMDIQSVADSVDSEETVGHAELPKAQGACRGMVI